MKVNFNTDRVDLVKAETDEYYEIEGLASTSDTDLQGEVIDQDGLDFSEIEYINANHGHEYKDKPGGSDLARMGLIDSAKMTKKGLWIKGKIFKNHPEASIYYNELKYGKPGLVQFSIEGNVLNRDAFNKSRVRRCLIRGVALTRTPVNTKTYATLLKSLVSEVPFETQVSQDNTPTGDIDPAQTKFDNLQDRYDALKYGHQELTNRYASMTKSFNAAITKLEEIKKAQILADKEQVKQLILQRIEESPEFRQKVAQVLNKALNPGGAQYTGAPDGISGGSVFMTEDLDADKKKKKKKPEIKKEVKDKKVL